MYPNSIFRVYLKKVYVQSKFSLDSPKGETDGNITLYSSKIHIPSNWQVFPHQKTIMKKHVQVTNAFLTQEHEIDQLVVPCMGLEITEA